MSTQINISKKITVKDEAVLLTSDVNSINFTGTGITATTVGNDVTVTVPGSSGGGGGLHAPTILKTGGYYSAVLTAATATNGSTSGSNIALYPFIPMTTITTSGFLFTNNSTAVGGFARILIYGTLNGLPSNKLYESADISTSTTGNKTVISSQTFTAGTTYWLAYATNTGPTGINCFPTNSVTSIAGNNTSIFTQVTVLYYSAVLGLAPATLNQALFGGNSSPIASIYLIAT